MYFMWCPKCGKTARTTKNEIGDYKEQDDYGCHCNVPTIPWGIIRLFAPEQLPLIPIKDISYTLESVKAPFTPEIAQCLTETFYDVADEYPEPV